MARALLPLAIFIALLGLFYVGLGLNPREVPSPLIDKPAPPFRVPQLQDPAAMQTAADFLGNVTLFNVWASWCVACRQEHPLLVELAKTGRVSIVGLNYKDEREDALRWLRQFGNPYDVVAYDRDGRVGLDWGVYGVPETFIVDKQGIIRYKQIGPVTPDALRQTILPLMAKLQQEETVSGLPQ